MKKIFLITFLALGVLSSIPAQIDARTDCPTEGLVPCGTDACPCEFCDIFVLINKILSFVLNTLVPAIAVLFLIFGGLYMLFARGNPGTLGQAKSILTAVVIGIVIIFIAWVALNTFLSYMKVAEWTGFFDNPATSEKEGWWKINCP